MARLPGKKLNVTKNKVNTKIPSQAKGKLNENDSVKNEKAFFEEFNNNDAKQPTRPSAMVTSSSVQLSSEDFELFKPFTEEQQVELLRESVKLSLARIGGVRDESTTTSQLLKSLADVYVYGRHMSVSVENYEKVLKEEAARVEKIPSLLKLTLINGKDLAAKDSTGFSDPYGLLAILDSQASNYEESDVKKSEVCKQTLNPEWNQTFEFFVKDWIDQKLVADFWDFDEKSSIWESLKNDQSDDFLGRLVIPLAHIDSRGLLKTYPLCGRSKKSSISGEITLKFEVVLAPTDVITWDSEILKKYNDLDACFVQMRDGSVESPWHYVLSQFCLRHNIPKPVSAAVRWVNLVRLAYLGRASFACLRVALEKLVALDMLNNKDTYDLPEPLAREFKQSFLSLNELFLSSIEKLQEIYPMSDETKTANLNEYFELMSDVYATAYFKQLLDAPKLMANVSEAVKKNAEWRITECKRGARRESKLNKKDEILTLYSLLENELFVAKSFGLKSPLAKILKIDYLIVLLKTALPVINERVNDLLNKYPLGSQAELNPRVFDGYYTLQNIIKAYMKLYASLDEHALHHSHEMYAPYVTEWLRLSGEKTKKWVDNAIRVDDCVAMDGELYSSSVLDVFSGLSQTFTFLTNLNWPDPVYYTIFITMFAQMVCDSVSKYASCMRNNFETTHEEAQLEDDEVEEEDFDITTKQCVQLNNLNQIHVRMSQIFELIDFPTLIDQMRRKIDTPFEPPVKTLFSETETQVGEQINFCMDSLARKMSTPILKYIKQSIGLEQGDGLFASLVSGDKDLSKDEVEEAIQPFLDYLNKNLATLSENLYHDLFRSILFRVWTEVVNAMDELLTPDVKKYKLPLTVSQASATNFILDILHDYFYADGDGIKLAKLNSEEYAELCQKLGYVHESTSELVKIYFNFEVQNQANAKMGEESSAVYHGDLEMELVFNPEKNVLFAKLIKLTDIPAMDDNGLSDPYVILNLLPAKIHPATSCKSSIKKETLNPYYNEHFSFDIGACDISALSLQLQVYDYDFIGGDDYIGETLIKLGGLNLETGKAHRNVWKIEEFSAANAAMLAINGHLNIESTLIKKNNTVKVTVVNGKNLPAMDTNGFSDPFVEINMLPNREVRYSTKTKYKTLDPEFNETFELSYEDEATSLVQLSVYDYDLVGTNDYIGEVLIPLDTLSEETLRKEYNLYRSATSIMAKFIFCILNTRSDAESKAFASEQKEKFVNN